MVALSTVSAMQAAATQYDAVTAALAGVYGLSQTQTVSVDASGGNIPPTAVNMALSSLTIALQTEQARLLAVLTSLGVTSLS